MLVNEETYATELSRRFGTALTPWQKALERLERGNILVSTLTGRTRVYKFNPRYFFLDDLKKLIAKGYEQLPQKIKEKYYEPKIRERPRRKGKPL